MTRELPPGWETDSLGQIADFEMGQAPPGSTCNRTGDGIPFVKAGEFGRQHPIIREWTTKPLKFARQSDVLICVVGATAGKLNLGADCAIGRSVAAIRPTPALDQRFLYYQLIPMVLALREGSAGTAQGVISKEDLSAIPIAVSPLAEQRRIVAKIEALLERGRRAREALEAIPALLDRYRQSILAAAFRGDLTAEWREKHPAEPAPQVLLGKLISDIRYGTAQKCHSEGAGTAVLRIPNVAGGKIDLSDLKYAELDVRELGRLALRVGDVLVIRSNGSANLVGRPAMVTEEASGLAYAGYLIRLRPDLDKVIPEYLCLMLEAPQTRMTVEVNAKSTSGVHNINSGQLASLPIPCPTLAEQHVIVDRVRGSLAAMQAVAGGADSAEVALTTLTQSILAKAFRGELVPQNPDDEPASVLLERIRAEQSAVGAPRRGRPAGRPKKSAREPARQTV